MPESNNATPWEFEFDQAKSRANKAKHGIDFVEAQELWEDERLAEAPARMDGEERFIMIGRIGERHWAAVVTYRGQAVRIISVRRARTLEVQAYEDE